MTKKQKREWAIEKAVSVLTDNNPIDIFLLGELTDKLEAIADREEIGLIIATEYSPEGPMTWQQLLAA